MESKEEIRKRILDRRKSVKPEELYRSSTAIFNRICGLDRYKGAKVVLVYMDYKNEVMTGDFIARCLEDGKGVALPKVEGTGAEHGPAYDLAVYRIKAVTDAKPGFKGIPEPEAATTERLAPEEIDLAVIPGVAFDRRKNRIGYGAGYYDRFLHKLRKDCLKVAAAFELQLVEAIPASERDIPVDMVVTEKKIIE
jgi:5-formyltetrahydrofolate cyclo-ligase